MHLTPAGRGEIADEDEAGSPDDPAGDVVEREGQGGHPRHPRQTRDEDAEGRGKAPEEDRRATPLPKELLGFLGPLQVDQPADGPLQDPSSESPTDEISDRVANDRAEDRGHHRLPEGNPILRGEHSPEDDGDLPRKEKSEKDRGLQRRKGEDDQQSRPALERKDLIRDPLDHQCREGGRFLGRAVRTVPRVLCIRGTSGSPCLDRLAFGGSDSA